jgi:hypothetical protein
MILSGPISFALVALVVMAWLVAAFNHFSD